MNNKKITVGTTTKKKPSAIIAAATTIAPVLASATRILEIRKQRPQQTYERKGITNKKDLSLLFGRNYDRNSRNIAFSSCIHVLGGLDGIIGSLVGPRSIDSTFSIDQIGILLFIAGMHNSFGRYQ